MNLYRTTKSNYVSYPVDGTGRDAYINYDGGGFIHRPKIGYEDSSVDSRFRLGMPRRDRAMKLRAPNFKYYSDGSGRDGYITYNSGGLFYDSKPLASYKLDKFLRTEQSSSYSPNKIIALSLAEIKRNKELRKIENKVISRLYWSQKPKFFKHTKQSLTNEANSSFGDSNRNFYNYYNKTEVNNNDYKVHETYNAIPFTQTKSNFGRKNPLFSSYNFCSRNTTETSNVINHDINKDYNKSRQCLIKSCNFNRTFNNKNRISIDCENKNDANFGRHMYSPIKNYKHNVRVKVNKNDVDDNEY